MEKPMDYAELERIAQSQAGQKLLTHLQRSGGDELQKAMEQAAKGDFSQAKKQISTLLDSPEAKKLLKELGGIT